MLNIITGRTGSGKTRLVRKLAAEIATNYSNKAILIVPEQFSFETEKAMLEILKNDKINNIEILSFSRLAERLLGDSGALTKKIADDGIKSVFMSLAIETLQDKISIYKKYQKSPVLISELLSFYKELKKYCINFESLYELSHKVKKSTFKNKLSELSLIFSTYNAMISQNYDDDCQYLDLLYDYLSDNPYFKNKTIFIDGFSGFSKQEYNIVERIISSADDTYVTFCCDTKYNNDRYELFYNAQTEINKLKNIAKKCNVKIAPEKNLTIDRKFKPEPLNVLEENIYSQNDLQYKDDVECISLIPCNNIMEECDAVASEIKRLVRLENYRYRDIAVIERTEGAYKDELLSSFRKYGVSCFEDNRQPIIKQPLMSFIFTLFDLLNDGMQTENILRFLKTGLFGFSVEEIAMIEDYCLSWHISASQWKNEWTENPSGFGNKLNDFDVENLNKLNELRSKIVAPVLALKKKIKGQNGEVITSELFKFLRTYHIDDNLKSFVSVLTDNDEKDLSLEQDRVWKILMDIFDSMYYSVGEYVIPLKRYCELFNLLASSKDLGQIPSGIDEVMFGSADRMRASAPKAVFIVGANSGVFPMECGGEVLLNDAERCELIDNGADIVSNLEYNCVSERFIAYHSLTLATEKLYISYSAMDNNSVSMTPSEIVKDIKELFPKVEILNVDTLSKIESRKSAFSSYAEELKKNSSVSSSLFEYFYKNGSDTEKNMIKKINKDTFKITDKEIATELFGKDMYISASKTEKFYKCPFEYFCEYGIKAKPKREAVMDPAQTGTLVHFALENFLRNNKKDELLKLKDEDIEKQIIVIIDDYVKEMLGGYDGKDASFLRSIELIKKSAVDISIRLRNEFAQCKFIPTDFELSIDNDGEISPYLINTKDGSTVKIIGKIDRVDSLSKDGDTYIRIVDYKTGTKNFNLYEVFAGINMQMLIYLFAIWQNGSEKYGNVVPAGILYYQAKGKRAGKSEFSRNSTPEEIQKDLNKSLKMSGMVVNSPFIITAMENDAEGIYIPASIDKNGNAKGSVISFNALTELKNRVDDIISKMAEELHMGYIDAIPIDGACDYCQYKDVCRHEENGKIKEIDKMNHKDALELLVNEEAQKND